MSRPSPRHGADDGVAILFVLVSLLVVGGLTVMLLGVLLSELGPTVYQRKTARSMAASQAGLQSGLAAIRAAASTSPGTGTTGDRSKLPCPTAADPLRGSISGLRDQGTISYAVQIRYYTVNPRGQTEEWRAANALACAPGSGTAVTPLYALLQALGEATTGGGPLSEWGKRSTELVYTFNRTDQAFLGGVIRTDIRATSDTNLCWEAASVPAVAGTTVRLAPCSPGAEAQTWSYRPDYSIVLSQTQLATFPPTGGMCLSADGAATASGAWLLTLEPCVPGAWAQLWAYDDVGRFQGVTSTKSSLSNRCISTRGVFSAGAGFVVEPCGWPNHEWDPTASVGAGAAGAPTQQIINYAEYGRCLDVTVFDVDYPWLINYPCKQDPTSGVGWNQRWVWDSATTRQIQSNTNRGLYCLTTPQATGGYVLTKPCSTNMPTQRWTMLGDTGNRSTSYTVLDRDGRCLSLGPPGSTAAFVSAYSSIVVEVCDGSLEQKWNAPPQAAGAIVDSERETTATG